MHRQVAINSNDTISEYMYGAYTELAASPICIYIHDC